MNNSDQKPQQNPIEDQYEKPNFRLTLTNGIAIPVDPEGKMC